MTKLQDLPLLRIEDGVDRLQERLDSLDERLDGLEGRMLSLEIELQEILVLLTRAEVATATKH